MATRIALIHAVSVAIEPVRDAFRLLWPEAACGNLLDNSLSSDRQRQGTLTEAMAERIGTLADYAASTGAAGILFTCSAFGPAIERAASRLPIPVLKPNEAMFEDALTAGERIGMLATFGPAVAGMEEEFRELARQRGRPSATIETICVSEAMYALRTGDVGTHNRLLAEAAPRLSGCDAVILAHFSTSPAKDMVSAALNRPVRTSPTAAVSKLRRMIEGVG